MSDKLKLDDLQSDGGLFAPTLPLSLSTVREEHRQSVRQPMAASGTLMLDGTEIPIKTIDISLGGLCIRSERQLVVGKEYPLSFDFAAGGNVRRVALNVNIIYCFYVGERDFKSGVEFDNLAPDVECEIRQFVGVTSK